MIQYETMKTYKYKLYSKAKDGKLRHTINRYGMVYNYCIELHRKWFKRTGKTLNKFALMSHLARIKYRPQWESIFTGLDAQGIENIAKRIDRALALYFRARKKHIKASRPKFRKVEKYSSFTLRQSGYKLQGNKVRLNGIWYGFHKSQDWKGKIKTITIKRDRCGDFWLFVVTDWVDSNILPKSGKSVGYDFGMKTYLYASDYNDIEAPWFFALTGNEHKRLSRAIARKKEGSKNRQKAVIRRARFWRTITNRRNDFQWKLASRLVREYDTLCFEDLNLQSLKKRIRKNGHKHGVRRYGRKINEFCFGNFLLKLKYKAQKAGKKVIQVPWNFPSSQLCSACGNQNAALRDRSIVEWECPNCHAYHDRNHNAAINILKEGTSSFWRDSVRPSVVRKVARAAMNQESHGGMPWEYVKSRNGS